MPTENRSSNTEMVSVPREWLNSVALLQMPLDELQEQAIQHLCEPCDDPAQQQQGEPVALPARKTHKKGNSPMQNAKNSAWNACLDEIAKLGPLYTHPAPVRGEPVAWMDPRSPQMHATISNEVKQHNVKFGGAPASAVNGYTIPLYTHADSAEVESIKADKQPFAQNAIDLRGEIERLRADLEAMTADRNAERGMKAAARLQRDEMTKIAELRDAQLAEAHALLRDAYEDGFRDGDRCHERGDHFGEAMESGWLASDACKALSASAEPSAPAHDPKLISIVHTPPAEYDEP